MNQIAFILIFLVTCGYSQNGTDLKRKLEQNAISISQLDKLDSTIYDELKDYDVIMIGEMHGTNEPASFVSGLVKLIADREGKVVLAMEIPENLIKEFEQPISKENLRKTIFFSMENVDGRNGQAWYDLICKSSYIPGVEIKFIDNETVEPRDSSMYLDIKNIRLLNPKVKIISLTGNIHNWLKPFRNEPKLGTYITRDTVIFNSTKIMSINHMYKEGTMMNNTGNGLELKTVEGKDNFYNKTIKSKIYLCKTLFESQNQYTHFLFTEKVTHSGKLNN